MKYSQIIKKTDKQLGDMLSEQRQKLKELARGLRTREVEKNHEVSVTKRTIARVLTEQRRRALAAQDQLNSKEQT